MNNRKKGFTLIELIMVIVILGILAAVAIPKYADLSATAKLNALKGALGGIRATIAVKYAENAVGGSATYPATIDSSLFADSRVPQEPYTPSNSVVTSYNGAGGWVYYSSTGTVEVNVAGYRSY